MKLIFFIGVILSSVLFPHLLVENNLIYNNNTNKYYSHDEFIVVLEQDINFSKDKDFIKYKKSVDRLKFKSMKYAYGYSVMGVVVAIDKYNHPDENLENTTSYKDTFASSIIIPLAYYSFNKVRRDNSLYSIAKKYNNLYSEEKFPDSTHPYNWSGSISYGLFSEKIPIGCFNASVFLNKGEHAEFYGTFHTMIFGGGIGIGYRYYVKPKVESSLFTSICLHSSVIGDGYETTSGLSFTVGYSRFLNEREYEQKKYDWRNSKYYTQTVNQKTFMNVGLSFSYVSDFNNGNKEEKYSLQLVPFINSEIRF